MTQRTSIRLRSALLLTAALTLVGAGMPSEDWSQREQSLSSGFGFYLAGRFAVQSHDMALAATAFEKAVREDPGVPELTGQAFLAALLAGQKQAAGLAESLPDNPLAAFVLADRDAKAGRWAKAEARFAGLSQEQPLTQVLRPLLVAWAQQGQGETDAALRTLEPLVAGKRFRGVYALHAGLIADLGGKEDETSRFYKIAMADYGTVNLRLGVIIASWQARRGQVDAAQRTIEELAGADGDLAMARRGLQANVASEAVRNPKDGIAEAYLAMAATLRQQGSESALAMVRLALDVRPDFTAALILLADIDDAAKRPEQALDDLTGVASDDPLAPMIALRRGALLAETGQSQAAEQVFDRLARDYPDRPEPLAQKGDMVRRSKDYAGAARAYTAAIDRLGTPKRDNWPLFYARGIAYERDGDWAKAEPDLRYALQLAPDQASVLNYLAYSWAERGEHLQEARSMLDKAASARPKEGAIIDSLGWVMLRQGDVDGAIKQLERAVELMPEDAVINGHLGDALAAAGRMREAEFQWRRALNLKPEEDEAKKLTAKLEALPGAATPASARSTDPATPR